VEGEAGVFAVVEIVDGPGARLRRVCNRSPDFTVIFLAKTFRLA
jgi:hypothetical protein